MRIALLGPSHPWRGGIAHYTARLERALTDAGHDVLALNFRRLYPDLLFPGRTQRDRSDATFDIGSEAVFDPINPLSWIAAVWHAHRFGADRLVLQWWHPYFAPGYTAVSCLARLFGIDTILQCHNVRPHERTALDSILLRLAYSCPGRFVVQSESEARRLEEYVGAHRPIDVAAHPPYDLFTEQDGLSAEQWRDELDLDADFVLLFFGLVRPYKGVDVLLDAVARLPDELDWQLVIAGEIYDGRSELIAQADALALDERVRFVDRYVPNEDVDGLFELADLCVLPYRHATGSGVANIAVANSTPLVMSDLPDLRESFGEGVFWFDTGDSHQLAETIEGWADGRLDPAAAHASDTSWSSLVETLTEPRT